MPEPAEPTPPPAIITRDGIYVTPEVMAKLRDQLNADLDAQQLPPWDGPWLTGMVVYTMAPAPRRPWWKRALARLARALRIGRR